MAWNEPGGGNRDPWSGGGGNQGPPDLDEIFRKIKDRVSRLLGGRGGRGEPDAGGPSGGGLGSAGVLIIVVIAVGAWLLSGVYIVDEGLRGVVTRFGKHVATAEPGPHWHWPYPISSVDKVNVSVRRSISIGESDDGRVVAGRRSMMNESVMLTSDENLVSVNMEVQYRVADAAAYLFRFREPDKTLKDISVSALRGVVGRRDLGDLLAQDDLDVTFDQLGQEVELNQAQIEELRAQSSIASKSDERDEEPPQDLVSAIKSIIVEHAKSYGLGLEVIEVNVGRTRAPEAVQDAFDDAVRAREDMRRLIQEAIAYKNQQVPQARGRAARISAQAGAYAARTTNAAEGAATRFTELIDEYRNAPDVTRQRLYLETMESVLDRSGKILIDSEAGQPLMYLPLQRMMQQGKGGSSSTSGPDGGSPLPGLGFDRSDTGGGGSGSSSGSARSRTREAR